MLSCIQLLRTRLRREQRSQSLCEKGTGLLTSFRARTCDAYGGVLSPFSHRLRARLIFADSNIVKPARKRRFLERLLDLLTGRGNELQRSRVHAVAQAGGLRSVRKDVAQVGVTAAAANLRALHEPAIIRMSRDSVFADRLPETRPAGAGVKLRFRVEERLAAADASVEAGLLGVPVRAGEGPLCPLAARDAELLVGE